MTCVFTTDHVLHVYISILVHVHVHAFSMKIDVYVHVVYSSHTNLYLLIYSHDIHVLDNQLI